MITATPTLAQGRSSSRTASHAVLHRLLDDSLAFAPEFDGTLANHLPMALAALAGLGASEAQMQAFQAHYATRLQAAPPAAATPPTAVQDWRAMRGRAGAGFAPLRALFATALSRHGRDAVLREALPALLDGAAGSALHGPIRVAHAIESAHEGELAAALGYWAATWTPLPAPQAPAAGFASAADWLEALAARLQQAEPTWRATAAMISDRMQQAAQTSAYAELAGSPFGDMLRLDARLADLARAAAARYAATGNFTVLHLATGARAAKRLSAWLSPQAPACAALLHAVAAASLAARATPRGFHADDRATWDDVRRQACASDDDHVIKLVHAMLVQNIAEPDPVWLRAARVAVAPR
jgi:hypothetical protein